MKKDPINFLDPKWDSAFNRQTPTKKQSDNGFFRTLADLAIEGGKSTIAATRLSGDVISGDFDDNAAQILSKEAARRQAQYTPPELAELQTAFKDEAQTLKEAEGFTEHASATWDFVKEFGNQIISNPRGIAYLSAEQIANMAPAMAGAYGGAKAGAAIGLATPAPGGAAIGGTIGAVAGAFTGGLSTEAGAEFMGLATQELQQRGYKPTEENFAKLLSDHEWRLDAIDKARKKGVGTAGTDAVITALGGRVVSRLRRAAITEAKVALGAGATAAEIATKADDIYRAIPAISKLSHGVGGAAIDIAGEGGSEAAGQWYSDGKIDAEEVALEIMGGLGGSVTEVYGLGQEFTKNAMQTPAAKARGLVNDETSLNDPLDETAPEDLPVGSSNRPDASGLNLEEKRRTELLSQKRSLINEMYEIGDEEDTSDIMAEIVAIDNELKSIPRNEFAEKAVGAEEGQARVADINEKVAAQREEQEAEAATETTTRGDTIFKTRQEAQEAVSKQEIPHIIYNTDEGEFGIAPATIEEYEEIDAIDNEIERLQGKTSTPALNRLRKLEEQKAALLEKIVPKQVTPKQDVEKGQDIVTEVGEKVKKARAEQEIERKAEDDPIELDLFNSAKEAQEAINKQGKTDKNYVVNKVEDGWIVESKDKKEDTSWMKHPENMEKSKWVDGVLKRRADKDTETGMTRTEKEKDAFRKEVEDYYDSKQSEADTRTEPAETGVKLDEESNIEGDKQNGGKTEEVTTTEQEKERSETEETEEVTLFNDYAEKTMVRYKDTYDKDPKQKEAFLEKAKKKWSDVILNAAKGKRLDDKILDDYIKVNGEEGFFARFRGETEQEGYITPTRRAELKAEKAETKLKEKEQADKLKVEATTARKQNIAEGNIVLTKDGNPFTTRKRATNELKNRGMVKTHKVIKEDGGFVGVRIEEIRDLRDTSISGSISWAGTKFIGGENATKDERVTYHKKRVETLNRSIKAEMKTPTNLHGVKWGNDSDQRIKQDSLKKLRTERDANLTELKKLRGKSPRKTKLTIKSLKYSSPEFEATSSDSPSHTKVLRITNINDKVLGALGWQKVYFIPGKTQKVFALTTDDKVEHLFDGVAENVISFINDKLDNAIKNQTSTETRQPQGVAETRVDNKETDIRFSRDPNRRKKPGAMKRMVQAKVNQIIKRLKFTNAPPITAVQSESELPSHLKEQLKEKKANGEVGAIYDPYTQQVFIISDNVHDVADVQTLILHEVAGHHGVRGVLGKRLDSVLDEVFTHYGKDEFGKIAKDYELDLTNIEHQRQAAEEMLASSQEYDQKHQKFIKRIYAKIRELLRRIGVVKKMTDNDIASLLRQSYKYAQKGKRKTSNQSKQVLFSLKNDKHYMSLVDRYEKGDKTAEKELRKAVDDAAKRAGYTVEAYHGTDKKIKVFKKGWSNGHIWGDGFYFTNDKFDAQVWAERTAERSGLDPTTISTRLSFNNPLYLENTEAFINDMLPENVKKDLISQLDPDYNSDLINVINGEVAEESFEQEKYMEEISGMIEDLGYDAIIGDYDGYEHTVVFKPTQIKSADLITKDDNGNIIPLSERFDTKEDDIRFSIADKDSKPLTGQQTIDANMLRTASITDGVVHADGVGYSHYDLTPTLMMKAPVQNGTGFLTPDGKYLNRQQALAWVKENRPEAYKALDSTTRKNGLESQAYAHAEGVITDVSDSAEEFMKQQFGDARFSRKKNTTKKETIGKSLFPDVQKSVEENRGRKVETLKEKFMGRLVEFKNMSLNHFTDLDYKNHAEAGDYFRVYESSDEFAKTVADRQVMKYVKDMKPEEYDVFRQLMAFRDIKMQITKDKAKAPEDRMMDLTKPLAFGHKNEQELDQDIAHFESQTTPAIEKAIKERTKFMKDLRATAIRVGVLDEQFRDDDNFFHREVLQYMNDNPKTGVSPGTMVKKQKSRTGASSPFNTEFVEAEYAIVARMVQNIKAKEVLDRTKSDFDVSKAALKKMKDEGLSKKEVIPVDKNGNETHTWWTPDANSGWHKVLTITESQIQKVISGIKGIEEINIGEGLVKGKPEEWLIPTDIAKTLDQIKEFKQEDLLSHIGETVLNRWKQWILLNPYRFFKYNVNNTSGDLDITFAAYPDIITKYANQAMKDLIADFRGKASPELQAELLKTMEHAVTSAGITANDIPDVSEQMRMNKHLEALIPGDKKFGIKAATGKLRNSWLLAKDMSTLRENVLRLAAFRYFKDNFAAGRTQALGVSKENEVNQLKNLDEKAARLARDLLGDYGNLTQTSEWLRRKMIPFWSWQSINAPRYYRLFKNLSRDELQTGKKGELRAVGTLSWKAGKTAIRTAMLFAMVNAWNAAMFPEEEEELGESGRKQLHIIFGRRNDGTIISMRFQGALSDALGWFALEDIDQDMKSLLSGKSTLAQKVNDAITAPISRLYQSSRPLLKTAVEAGLGISTYPEFTSPRPVRDKIRHILRTFSLDKIYDHAVGKPIAGGSHIEQLGKDLLNVFAYSTDPGITAYYDTRKLASDFMEKETGQQRPTVAPTNKSNALYYYKQSLRFGDVKAAEKYLKKYYVLGGKASGIKISLKAIHPLGGIPKKYRTKFINSLDKGEKVRYQSALKFYQKAYFTRR